MQIILTTVSTNNHAQPGQTYIGRVVYEGAVVIKAGDQQFPGYGSVALQHEILNVLLAGQGVLID